VSMNESVEAGVLYVVATPIGNLADVSQRALDVLAGVDFIAAEDTRHSGRLLQHYQITTKTLALHDHNERDRAPDMVARLSRGKSIALISDAGTPLISDPGGRQSSADTGRQRHGCCPVGRRAALGSICV